ncbi:beta-ketoacyl-[acyl-carrier-protein] synthase family protein [Dolichospermum circinale]|uniref:beta-ketoacyl-[acyl-carrier-protein] synthase family protein n=1 Tax=Dolichospermum circinale TaxID=109265 RepID=UPI00232D1409|nr:beta-ketoacyl-[acyl-carrier-protein] synthase family protein [Dolichospermum circinale]MDB9450048.1 beta-ketoacyl-[acyl-carrier-protein] synthase family protein [Dolichospermum circinale CS-547]
MSQKVVITGMGTLNPNGKSVGEFWKNCCQGRSGVRPITAFKIPQIQSQMAGIVDDFDPWESIPHLPPTLDRSTLFALVATQEAFKSAGLLNPELSWNHQRCGVFISTAIAQITKMEQSFVYQSRGGHQPLQAIQPFAASRSLLDAFGFNSTAKYLARHFGLGGGYTTVTTGCTGGLDAIGYALEAIRSGVVDVAVTGSTEAPITPLTVAAFGKIGATSLRNAEPQQASRPFDRDRDGFVLAEGCGILVVESLDHAQARGATILAEVAGFGSVNNYYHMTDIPQDGLRIAKSAQLALQDGGITADEIDSINAHGSSTPQNDVAEANAFRYLFGERASTIPVTSTKSQIGHPLSASNSIEVIASVLSLRTGIIPPTINLTQQDPLCPLNVIANVASQQSSHCLLKTSSGFSGIHSSLVLRKYEGVGNV